ncbi:MAG: acyl-CoA thioesterase [Parachlamydiaceae bacterium]|nr:acyl-CoA thioesterase [Parachlamydiaceae bacterium]
MFKTKNRVRMHDTDMAGILYFARQFRFAHDALEDFSADEGFPFDQIFHKENFVFVVVHAEADYLAPLKVGDALDIDLIIEKIGNSSFTIVYKIYRSVDHLLVGTAKTVHVTLDATTRKKIDIPPQFRKILEKHLAS